MSPFVTPRRDERIADLHNLSRMKKMRESAMSIWFRIKHANAENYIIHVKIGKIEFNSNDTYTLDELPEAIRELSTLGFVDDE